MGSTFKAEKYCRDMKLEQFLQINRMWREESNFVYCEYNISNRYPWICMK